MAKKQKTQFGDWILIRKLTTHTGQANTYLVYKDGDEQQTQQVLKQMKGDGPFANRSSRFQQETEAYKRLSHQNIVRFIDSGEDRDGPFIVTDYCAGGSLSPEALVGKTLYQRLELFRGICQGIAYVHDQNMVHRDLKPDNIFLNGDGNPVVGDFGLCFFLGDYADRKTHFAEAVGPRQYMPPECEGGRTLQVGPTGDVYCLGKILYWMLAGRIFSRERHHQPPFDLRLNHPNPDMDIVYTLFDKTILENPAARLPNGAEVVRELDVVIEQISSRRRVFELANLPYQKADRTQVHMACFRPGSTVTYEMLDTSGFEPKGFAGFGDTLALWSVNRSGHKPTELAISTLPAMGDSWVRFHYQSPGTLSTGQALGYQSLTFDAQGDPSVAVVESQESSNSLLLITAGKGNGPAVTHIAEDVDTVRYNALALGPGGIVAAYCGYDSSLKSGVPSESIVKSSTGLDRHPTHPNSNFLAPLAFDQSGKLHQAIVASMPEQNRDVRTLLYFSRELVGQWSQETIDSTNGHNDWGLVPDGRMAGQISLCLNPDGSPVILTNSARSSTQHLAVYSLQSRGWARREIDLRPAADSFDIGRVETGGWKQILFDTYLDGKERKHRAHIAISTEGKLPGVLYLMLNGEWNITEQRFFPAKGCFGMSLGHDETVHLAFR